MKPRMIDYYMDVAARTAQLSRAQRLQVGCVIVKNDNIISFGWNGTPAGWDNECENKVWDHGAGGWLSLEEIEEQYPYEEYHPDTKQVVRYGLKTKPEVIHAEANAILKLTRGTHSSENSTMFLTHAPCIECAKLILSAGINNVYYRDVYRSTQGIEFLDKAQVTVTKL